jgi:outer membrane protein TolC
VNDLIWGKHHMSSIREPRSSASWALRLGALLTIGLVCVGRVVYAEEEAATETAEVEAAEADAVPKGPLSLEECIQLGLEKQPALAAARASLAAAQSGQQAVDNILLGRLVSPDLGIRRTQSCLGVTIASAGLTQAEWETRYAVRRTYYTIQYARMQTEVINRAVEKLEKAHKDAIKLLEEGDPKSKITKIDVDTLAVNKQFFKTKQAEAQVGIRKAFAALREALGVGLDYDLQIPLPNEAPLPSLVSELNKDELISQAQANRSELQQAYSMQRVTDLEISAQRRLFFRPEVKTFAAGGDIHAKPIPQGVANGEYRPGAIGPEMPPFLFGSRRDRVQRARDFSDRAAAVVDKTENLIVLEVEATYLKWEEARENVKNLGATPAMAKSVEDNVRKRFDTGNATGEEYLRARTLVDQAAALYNQALFDHALALAALERVTAGGYRIPTGK